MKLRTIIATAATAAVLASSGVAIAGATTSTDSHTTPTAASAPEATAAARPARARHLRIRRRLRRLAKGAGGVVTKTIGIDRKTLRSELRDGKTIAQIATEHNVQPQTVIDALVAAADKKIDAWVQAGKLAPARATRIEARLPARVAKIVNTWHPKRLRKAN